jgi:hypothetical protein
VTLIEVMGSTRVTVWSVQLPNPIRTALNHMLRFGTTERPSDVALDPIWDELDGWPELPTTIQFNCRCQTHEVPSAIVLEEVQRYLRTNEIRVLAVGDASE